MRVRPGVHVISNLAVGSDVWLVGVRGQSILQCAGSGDGLVIAGIFAHDIRIENLTLEAASASCGKAINFSNATYGAGPVTIRDVDITSTNAGATIWAFGLWSTFLEKANVESLNIYQAAAVGVHMENASNQVRFTGLDITGASEESGVFLRGIELIQSGPEFFGGTVEGYFSESAIRIAGPLTVQPSFVAPDVVNSNSAPGDGADIVVSAASNVSFLGVTGASSTLVTGTVRGCSIQGGVLGAVTFGVDVIGCMISSARVASITDQNGMNGWINIQTTNGSQMDDKIPWGQPTARRNE